MKTPKNNQKHQNNILLTPLLWRGWGRIFILVLLTLATSCKKPQPEPEPEQLPTGENTMYYYIDGKLFIPKDSTNDWGYHPAISYGFCNSEHITFEINVNFGIDIHFEEGINKIGKIVLNQSNYDSCQVFDNHAYIAKSELWNDGVYHTTWYYTHDGSGTINITYLSEDKKHFEGTFEMILYHEITNKEIHITDGHFNLNLNTLEL